MTEDKCVDVSISERKNKSSVLYRSFSCFSILKQERHECKFHYQPAGAPLSVRPLFGRKKDWEVFFLNINGDAE